MNDFTVYIVELTIAQKKNHNDNIRYMRRTLVDMSNHTLYFFMCVRVYTFQSLCVYIYAINSTHSLQW